MTLKDLLAEPAVDADVSRPERVGVEGDAGERLERIVAGEAPDREMAGIGAEAADAAQNEIQRCSRMTRSARLEMCCQGGIGDLGAGAEILDVMESIAVDC